MTRALYDFEERDLDEAASAAEGAYTTMMLGERPVEVVHFPLLSPAPADGQLTGDPADPVTVRIDDDDFGWWVE